jgi:hypothetical protein
MSNDGLCVQKKKNDIAWLKMWMLLLFMTSIYVKIYEGGKEW